MAPYKAHCSLNTTLVRHNYKGSVLMGSKVCCVLIKSSNLMIASIQWLHLAKVIDLCCSAPSYFVRNTEMIILCKHTNSLSPQGTGYWTFTTSCTPQGEDNLSQLVTVVLYCIPRAGLTYELR